MVEVRVVLVGIEGPVNLGVIARTCVNFGVRELYLVNPIAKVEEALRYSARGRELLLKSIVVGDLEKALSGVDISVATSAIGYSEGDVLRQAISIGEFVDVVVPRANKIALIFGRESTGLTRDELAKADFLVTIPADPEYPVLNVSQAVAIFLWEIWKRTRMSTPVNVPPRARREDLDTILLSLKEVIEKTVPSHDKRDRCFNVIRRLVYRSRPSIYEARVLYYFAKRVLRKLTAQQEQGGER